jgi:hypothetical protein
MRHRGRHRRRRRGRVLRATLAGAGLALTAAATLISASQATVAHDPGALKPLTSPAALAPLRLREEQVPRASLDRLASAMGRPVGVRAVLDGADRTLRTAAGCTAAEKETLPVEPAATRVYCWDRTDPALRGWRPRSVTTSGDADDDGRWGPHRVLLVGGSQGDGPGGPARVAFVNADDPHRLTYTWVLLAVPVDGGRDYEGLASRLTGMVWYQDKLLVTTSGPDRAALYVYDLHRIQRAGVTADAVGRVPGGWSAHGYRWVMPAVAAYRPARGACAAAADSGTGSGAGAGSASGTPCPAALSLDRGSAPDSLVAGEWVPAGGERHTRLWRYDFSSDPTRSGLLATDAAGYADAVAAYETKATGVRGVLAPPADGDGWYVGRTAADPADRRGSLWRQDTRGARGARCGGTGDSRHCWGEDPGALSYAPATGEVWSVTERALFAVPLRALTAATG